MLISHHWLFKLIGNIASSTATHSVREPCKTCRVKERVIVVLQVNVPIVCNGDIKSGIDTTKKWHHSFTRVCAATPFVRIAVCVATNRDHAAKCFKLWNPRTDLKIGSTKCGIKPIVAHNVVFGPWCARGSNVVCSCANRHVSITSNSSPVGDIFSRETYLLIDVTKLAKLSITRASILVHVAVIIPVQSQAKK